MKKIKYYSLDNILSYKAVYNMIIGERSNGKTYAVFKRIIQRFCETGEQAALVRRWQDDFRGKRGDAMFLALAKNHEIETATNGEWTDVYYYASKWFFCRYDEKGNRETAETPFCWGFAISAMEHDKSTSYPNITTIVFDEFISRMSYLPDEFVLFMNVVSTIVRDRTNVEIFMLGNTVNKYCPYFNEMGLTHVKDMKPGNIDLYRYGDSDLTVAVEYCTSTRDGKGKPSDMYFAFDNPKLQMITGGAWEIDIYPHCPIKYKPKDVLFTYFIQFNGDTLQCEIVLVGDIYFTFIHRKSGEIKNPETDLIFTPDHSPRPNYRRKITKPTTNIEKKIAQFYATDKVFYADNEIGEIVRNYILWCTT